MLRKKIIKQDQRREDDGARALFVAVLGEAPCDKMLFEQRPAGHADT